MLDLASKVLGANAHRADLIEGTIDDAPAGPFDGATCLLTLHFLDTEERIRTAAEIRARLKPGAPFVAAHGSFPQEAGTRDRWLDRYAAFAIASRSEEHTSELQSLMRISYAVFCLKKKKTNTITKEHN